MMLGQGYGYVPGAMADDVIYDPFYDRAVYKYKWCLWPRRCYASNRRLWLTWAVRGRATYTGPGEPVIEERWYNRDTALLMFMKRN